MVKLFVRKQTPTRDVVSKVFLSSKLINSCLLASKCHVILTFFLTFSRHHELRGWTFGYVRLNSGSQNEALFEHVYVCIQSTSFICLWRGEAGRERHSRGQLGGNMYTE